MAAEEKSRWGTAALLAIPVLVLAGLAITGDKERKQVDPAVDADTEVAPLDESQGELVAKVAYALWRGEPVGMVPERLDAPGYPAYVALRYEGVKMGQGWGEGKTALDALRQAMQHAQRQVAEDGEDPLRIDAIEIDLSRDFRRYEMPRDRRALLANVHRGVRGLELEDSKGTAYFAPSYAIATNRSFKRLIERRAEALDLEFDTYLEQAGIRTFEADQMLVDTNELERSRLMVRGNEVVPADGVTAQSTQQLADSLAGWLERNVAKNGRLTYKYEPSTGRSSKGNNMIRQFMATIALEKTAAARDSSEGWALAARNLDYNLRTFYRSETGPDGETYGLIEYNGKVKLGAMSLAALAIVLHPERERWASQEEALLRTIDSLAEADGSFRTFYKPADRTDNQNFYPGEALLLWAHLYRESPTDDGLARYMKAFDYYRRWHLEPANRNPAFVPWHSQAHFIMWEQTKDERLAEFVFEMNDWLVETMSQWGEAPYPDMRGRFYTDEHKYGVPHASSTGVYLEGLIDAYALAEALGDGERQERYRLAITRGLRSTMQLGFFDPVDMFYVRKRKRRYVEGGVRTATYDNVIRCDNVQHNLMAIWKILDAFPNDAYGTE